MELSTVYMVGYWFKDMTTTFTLCDANGNPIDGIDYFKTPVPENAINSREYKDGVSTSINGSITAGFEGKTPVGSITAGFEHTVSSEVSYEMDDIDYTLDSSTKSPKYDYQSKGVNPHTSTDYDLYWPKNCRTQWTVRQTWVWFVPRGKAGVDDNQNTALTLKYTFKNTYCNYAWVKVPLESSKAGNVRDFTPINTEASVTLAAPDRRTWGIVSIKNAASYALSNLKFYKKGEESKAPVATIDTSFGQNEVAEMLLPEGTYTVTYEAIDPNQDNKKLGDWKFEDVQVKQGKDKDAATTILSSVNAKKI